MTSPSPSCSLCGLTFQNSAEQRQHAKSESHVQKLRCRVAETESAVSPPASETKKSKGPDLDWTTSKEPPRPRVSNSDEESEGDVSSDEEAPEFVPEDCLFCSHSSKDFDSNMSHMHQTHSLAIPFQKSLAVDLETLVWYLHLVIFAYRECICCGKRRRTIEAVQQHMTTTGHCRFNMTEEMSEFYDLPSLKEQNAAQFSQIDDQTLRLPSGKLLTHRSYVEPSLKSKLRETSSAGPSSISAATGKDGSSQALTKKDRKEQAITTQLSSLRASERSSLMHLSSSQQRSLLLAGRKKINEARRTERRLQGGVENLGNYYKKPTSLNNVENPVKKAG